MMFLHVLTGFCCLRGYVHVYLAKCSNASKDSVVGKARLRVPVQLRFLSGTAALFVTETLSCRNAYLGNLNGDQQAIVGVKLLHK